MANEKWRLILNDKPVYSLKEIRENFNAEELAKSYKEGSLIRWLEFFFYEKTASKVRNINHDENLIEQITSIFMNDNEDFVDPKKDFIGSNEANIDDNREVQRKIFKNTEILIQEADNYHQEKNYREALKKYMDAYYLGNESAADKLIDSIVELIPTKNKEKFFKSRKFLLIIVAVLTVMTNFFAFGYFDSIKEITKLRTEIDSDHDKYSELLKELNETKRKLYITERKLKEAREQLRELSSSASTQNYGEIIKDNDKIQRSNATIRGNHNVIEGNDNNIYGNHNSIYGNNNRIH